MFSLSVDVLARKSSSIRDNLAVLKAGYNHGKDILLNISLRGITVYSSEHQAVMMTHPLKKISYTTCDPASCLFSFMSRDPASPPSAMPHIQAPYSMPGRGAQHHCGDSLQGCIRYADAERGTGSQKDGRAADEDFTLS